MANQAMQSLLADMPGLRLADSDMLSHASRALSLLSRLEVQRKDALTEGVPVTGRGDDSPQQAKQVVRASPEDATGRGELPQWVAQVVRASPAAVPHKNGATPPVYPGAGRVEQTSVGMRIQSHRALISSVESLLNESEPSVHFTSERDWENKALAGGEEVARRASNKNNSLREFLMAREGGPASSPRASQQSRSNTPLTQVSPPGDWQTQQQRNREIRMLRSQLSSQLSPFINPSVAPSENLQTSHPWESPGLNLGTPSEASQQPALFHTTEHGDFVVMLSPRGAPEGGDVPLSSRGETAEARRRRHAAERMFTESVLRDKEEDLEAEVREGRALAV